jgi:hypothetical protein
MRRIVAPLVVFSIFVVAGSSRFSTRTVAAAQPSQTGPEVRAAVHHDVSPPLRDIPSAPSARSLTERPLRLTPGERASGPVADGALQSAPAATATPITGLGFAGVGQGDYGFSDQFAPPDTNGAVGATQFVQWVNVDFAVFDKTTGAIAAGFPKAGNTIWQGFGGGCETNNDGDPIAQYDKIANRWVLTQFSVSTTPNLQCVAVSTTSDATGTYNRYAFDYGTDFPDYPKLGVWPDAYYITYNIFANGQTFSGPKVCAFDRTAMLAGAAATQQCFQLGTTVSSLLPSDFDGTVASLPAVGMPNKLARITSASSLQLWDFHVDFVTPANTTLTGPTTIAVAPYTRACNGGTCVPQPSTRQQLDSLADRAMYRFAFRHFADHDAWLLNHSVATSVTRKQVIGSGIRWYELRSTGGGPVSVFQQATFAPDANYRWMGSIAQDKLGNIAVGYSVSSSTTPPSIRVGTRAATDPAGTLGETSVFDGVGSQLRNLSRWGDYSAMTVDPVDDCTFWYTNEYLKTSGTFNWSTRIASFKLPGC